jgi:type 1 glutamine amidotransferase
MNFRIALSLVTILLISCNTDEHANNSNSGAVEEGPFKVLIYSRTAGFRHTSIEPGILAIQQLAAANDFEADTSEDPSVFTSENLAQYASIIWLNTTLDVLDSQAQRDAFETYIKAGGGYVGIHSAADTHHEWPFYGELVGAWFLSHPVANQPGTLRIEDTEHPSVSHLGENWSLPIEEFYSFKSNPRGAVRVLMNIDESGYLQEPNTSCDPQNPTFPQGYSGVMGDHPLSWCHDKYSGRAWYTAIGHSEYLYTQTDYQQHLLSGILIASRHQEASCAVNAAPDYALPYQPPELEACENQILP